MVTVLVDKITSRIEYTFEFIFGARGVAFSLVDDLSAFNNVNGACFNYSSHKVEVPGIFPSSILYSNNLFEGNVVLHDDTDIQYLKFDQDKDIVASIFYVLTRMEEYNSTLQDEHGRFPFSRSILNQNDWIDKAMCDRWSEYIVKNILGLDVVPEKGGFIPTFDIDNTYAYKYKVGKRKLLSTLKDYSKLDAKRLKERKEVNNGGKDPYDTFDKIIAVANRFPQTKLFWLTKSNGEKDRNLPIEVKEHQELIRKMSDVAEVNIHPSYGSFGSSEVVSQEIRSLEAITGTAIESSRQHFLRFTLPDTYQKLMASGINHEYSMGFAEAPGFRSGTARAHLWFDLERNEVSSLIVHPFVYMDGTLLEYKNLTIEEAKTTISELYAEVQKYGGDFIFLWHNETIGDYGKWKDWSEVLDYTLSLYNE